MLAELVDGVERLDDHVEASREHGQAKHALNGVCLQIHLVSLFLIRKRVLVRTSRNRTQHLLDRLEEGLAGLRRRAFLQ